MQMLDSVEGAVHHLAYERGEDVIVMKGYKFAKAKTAAATTLGCLALANSAVATQLVQVLAFACGLKASSIACSLLVCPGLCCLLHMPLHLCTLFGFSQFVVPKRCCNIISCTRMVRSWRLSWRCHCICMAFVPLIPAMSMERV